MNGLKNGIRSACLIDLVLFALIALLLSQCACLSTLPVEPAPAVLSDMAKGVNTPAVIYTSTPELIRKVCLTADAVNLRTGAGTGFESKAVLSAGDTLTLTGEHVRSLDGGIWWPVDTETGAGFVNARYVCER